MAQTYRDLIVWQKSMKLVVEVYRSTEQMPKHELYGLASQMRRAAVSIPSNIAEGQERAFDREFSHFLSNARGSLMELETQAEIAHQLGYIAADQLKSLATQTSEIGKILNGLMQKVKSRAASS